MSEEASPEAGHGRHFTREQEIELLPKLEPMLRQLQQAKVELTD
jgi:hypothetical protein